LEVLVAFAVLALVLGVLFRIFSGGLNVARLTEQYGRATLLAESKLSEVGVEEPLREGQSSGAFESTEDYHWQLTVSPYVWSQPGTSSDNLSVHPYEVTVEVLWGEEEQSRSISLTTLRLVPRP
jgi:general secretion pathway protein I